jgi:uncharacterized protein (DUF2141 family)
MRLLTAALLVAALAASTVAAAPLTITVDNLRSAKGEIRLSLYASPAEWPDKSTKDHDFVMTAQAGHVVFRLDVPPGGYAVNGFHDENGNGKFDTNFLGIPEEGYFFSNDVRPFLSAPGLDAAKFAVPPEGRAMTVRVLY